MRRGWMRGACCWRRAAGGGRRAACCLLDGAVAAGRGRFGQRTSETGALGDMVGLQRRGDCWCARSIIPSLLPFTRLSASLPCAFHVSSPGAPPSISGSTRPRPQGRAWAIDSDNDLVMVGSHPSPYGESHTSTILQFSCTCTGALPPPRCPANMCGLRVRRTRPTDWPATNLGV